MPTARTTGGSRGGAGSAPGSSELLPREYLRIIAIWSLIPSYIVAGGLIGYLLDRWLDTFPFLTGLALLAALVMAVRDMLRLRDELYGGAG